MIMADECDVSEIVTKFLFNTCRLLPRVTERNMQAVMLCAFMVTKHPEDDEEAEIIPLTTGSVAEFYIEPMLPNVGDIDVMFHHNTQLAIPRGHPPPTQLPAEFHSYVKVHEIIDSHLPGYVYLRFSYLLTRFTVDGKYYHYACEETNIYYASRDNDSTNIHGPATLTDRSNSSQLSVDSVLCIHCLVWPQQAADWPTRHRNYDWPDSATLDRVVSNGCDVVRVAHRLCKQHEWMGKFQWRLSFSRAEIVLINSWMPVQQIVYHLLRYFMKTERLTDCADKSEAGTLSNYHIKTLMLWACELKPRSWWTANLNLVRICVELLNTLSVWMTDIRCPHYFVNNCNLLDNSFNVGSVASKLMSIDEDYLSTWFVNNYIGQCAQRCPNNVSRLYSGVCTRNELQNAVSRIIRWRLNTTLDDLWHAVRFAEYYIPRHVPENSLSVRSCIYCVNELTKIDECFTVYFSATALLHVAYKISRNGFSDEVVPILSTILERSFSQFCGVLSPPLRSNIPELVGLLQKSAVEHLTTFRQLEARLFVSVVTIVTTDFEALYAYKRGDYQRCLQLSTQNVHTLWNKVNMFDVQTFPEFIPLMDVDIVSLTALILMENQECRDDSGYVCISQVTLSLYLMTQCQLKLGHSMTSLAQTLDYIKVAQRRHPRWCVLDQLTLKLIERKVTKHLPAAAILNFSTKPNNLAVS